MGSCEGASIASLCLNVGQLDVASAAPDMRTVQDAIHSAWKPFDANPDANPDLNPKPDIKPIIDTHSNATAAYLLCARCLDTWQQN